MPLKHEMREAKAPEPSYQHESSMVHLHVSPNDNGGVVVTHHSTPRSEPHARHSFAAHEGQKFMQHMALHSGMSAGEEEAE